MLRIIASKKYNDLKTSKESLDLITYASEKAKIIAYLKIHKIGFTYLNFYIDGKEVSSIRCRYGDCRNIEVESLNDLKKKIEIIKEIENINK